MSKYRHVQDDLNGNTYICLYMYPHSLVTMETTESTPDEGVENKIMAYYFDGLALCVLSKNVARIILLA